MVEKVNSTCLSTYVVDGWSLEIVWKAVENRKTIFTIADHEIFGTPWKINMEPETDGLEDDFPFQLGDF